MKVCYKKSGYWGASQFRRLSTTTLTEAAMRYQKDTLSEKDIKRFWSHVQKTDGCWIWTRSATHDGYGSFSLGGRTFVAHRVAWIIEYGQFDQNLCVCHHCDNPICVRAEHLFLGTHADNMEDMVRKGRQALGDKNAMRLYPERIPRGSKNGSSKFTEEQIRTIHGMRIDGCTLEEIAKIYNTNAIRIGLICKGKYWQHVYKEFEHLYSNKNCDCRLKKLGMLGKNYEIHNRRLRVLDSLPSDRFVRPEQINANSKDLAALVALGLAVRTLPSTAFVGARGVYKKIRNDNWGDRTALCRMLDGGEI